jgi:hypothetical protein
VVLALAASVASAQSAQQLVKEAWVATKTGLLELGTQGSELGFTPRFSGGSNLVAVTFEPPPAPGETRHVIAADGFNVLFLREGDPSATVENTINLANATPGLTNITALAATDHGTLLISGWSKRRKWFELWEATINGVTLEGYALRAADHPQLTDAVYIPSEDIADDSTLAPGLVAAAGRQILSFSAASDYNNLQVLLEVRNLPLPNNANLLSVDLVRGTNALVVATSTRKLLVTSPLGADPETFNIPDVHSRNCAQIKTQRLKLRVARGGTDDAVLYLADGCGQALRYEFDDPYTDLEFDSVPPNDDDDLATPQDFSGGLVALAVGEGNSIVCEPNVPCQLVTGFTLTLQEQAELFYTEYAVCDPRVLGSDCEGGPGVIDNEDFILSLSTLLPPSGVAQLDGADPTLGGDMYSWNADGSLKVFIINAATPWEQGVAEGIISSVPLGFAHLPVELGLPAGTSVQRLLNQAQVGYAPDGDELPTVGHWSDCASLPCYESAAVVTGAGSARTTLRSNSVITAGVMFDLRPELDYDVGGRVPARCQGVGVPTGCVHAGGIPLTQVLTNGSPPLCNLVYNGQTFTAVADSRYYFVDMAACLFSDLERLLTSTEIVPDSAFGGSVYRNALIDRLGIAEDKLIKGLNSVGSPQGSQNLGAVVSQMANFQSLVDTTPFADTEDAQVFRNELTARNTAFVFNLVNRTIPSIGPNGILP